jgi:hypothetical protein
MVTTDPSPATPRQREIVRRLQLVGGAPASYFSDACRLMAREPQLESQTHLVSHLLRELNSGLLGALKPMVAPEDWPEKGTDDRQAKMIGAICDALRVPADDPLRGSWKTFSRKPAELAHRRGLVAPRPVDREFEDYWELGETVFHAVTQRIEANYAENLPRIEQLATGPPDIRAYRDTMLHSTVALDRFYALAGVEWLGPLRDDGAFDNPPPLVANEEGMYVYPRWPPGRFLARVAADAPREVIEIGRGLETNNPEAQESLAEAALNMELSDAGALVGQIGQWLESPVHWRLPFKARDLIVRFVDGGVAEEGLALVRPLVTTAGTQGIDTVDGEEVLWLVERIFPAVGLAGFDLVVDLVTEQAKAEDGRSLEYSQIWRPDIRSERIRDDRDHLVSGVRDAARSLAGAGMDIGEVVAALERPELEITRRIAMDLLSLHVTTDAAKSHLLDREILEDGAYRREYAMLAEAGFAQLATADQAQLLEWIGEARQYAEHPERQRFWQLQMLTALGDQLPEGWISTRAELEGELGPVESATNVSLPRTGFVGSRSPITPDEAREMEIDELLDYLRTWEPEDGFDTPSREGLASVLEDVVKESPAVFSAAAPGFADDIDPTYVRALLGGLDGALQTNRRFDWRPILDLIEAISNRPVDPDHQNQISADGDPGWSWGWQQALDLILHGLDRHNENKIDGDHFDSVTAIAHRNVERPDPSLTDKRETSLDPASLALNSVRCKGIRAVIVLAERKREADAGGTEGLDSDTATLLDEYLNPEKEPSGAVRSIFGWYFGTLMFCDEAWAIARVPVIFPIEDTRLWRAAWESLVMSHHAHDKLLQVLEPNYRRAVEEISSEKPEERLNDPDEALVAHLMSYYLSGSIDFGSDSLLDRFYETASTGRRSQAISILGTSMEALSPLGEEGGARLRTLAERRLEAVEGGADADELAGISWWFSSGEFDTTWSLDFLRKALEAGCHPRPDHVIAERLAQLSGQNVTERIAILRLMVEGGARDWFVVGSREKIEAILREGLAGGGEANSQARDLINVLVAGGNLDFDDLLREGGGEGSG